MTPTPETVQHVRERFQGYLLLHPDPADRTEATLLPALMTYLGDETVAREMLATELKPQTNGHTTAAEKTIADAVEAVAVEPETAKPAETIADIFAPAVEPVAVQPEATEALQPKEIATVEPSTDATAGVEKDILRHPVELAPETPPAPAPQPVPTASTHPTVPQPNSAGEFVSPLGGALFMASQGIPQTPLHPRTKRPILGDWPDSATTDAVQIQKWAVQFSDCNFGSVGKAGAHFVFEADSLGPRQRFESLGGTFTSKAIVISSKGGHRWYLSAPGVTNVSQAYTKHGDFSVRAENQQCVSPGSIHPDTGRQYVVGPDWAAPAVPTKAEIDFWNGERVDKKKGEGIKRDVNRLIPHGSIHGFLLKEGGELRAKGFGIEIIEPALLDLAHTQCAPPIDESKVITLAQSICGSFPAGTNTDLIMTQAAPASALPELPELPTMPNIPYPVFPDWVMLGTSVYENFVKPICDANSSRIPYFMFMPAVAVTLNYLGTKVRVEMKNLTFSSFVVLIGDKGQTKKSSCMDDAIAYYGYIGITTHSERDVKNAEGRTMVFTAGSPEGLGLEMQKLNCKNALLLYDELSILANKAGIESSSLKTALLTMHESKKQANGVKSQKESYSLLPGTYVLGLVAGCTTKTFPDVWARISAGADGMDDRFSFFMQPEFLPERSLHVYVNVLEGSKHTKVLLDRAVTQQKYAFVNLQPLQDALARMTDRDEIRAEKYALFFAVDLGRTVIDEDCVRRALAIVDYEISVKKYHKTSDADNALAVAQLKVRTLLERARGGYMTLKELEQKMNCSRYGTMVWAMIYGGLIKAKIIAETGEGTKADPTGVQVLKLLENV